MFEFLLIDNSIFNKNKIKFPYFNKEMNQIKKIHFNNYTLYALSYLNENDIAEDKDGVVAIYGSLYYPIGSEKEGSIEANDLLDSLPLLEDPARNLRGNYAIVYWNKLNSTIKIINDPLGLKPVYYGVVDNKIFVSSSLYLLKLFNNKIDETGLLETLIFDYNISDGTVLDNFHYLGNGVILVIRNNNIKKIKYFSILDFALEKKNQKFSFDEFVNLVDQVLYNKNLQKNKILISLTGGNDGRAVLSAAYKNNFAFDTFSFGMQNGENTFIPEKIAKHLNSKHISIYLDKRFEKEYLKNAIDTIILSDGNLSFEQQSSLYCFRNLPMKIYKNKVYTGLLAGEMLGPIHLKHDYFDVNYFRVVYQNINFDLSFIKNNKAVSYFVNIKFIKKKWKEIIPHVEERRKFIKNIRSSPKPHLYYYLDLIELGFRKFYGSQMHLIRYQAENIPVFYDLDILNYLLNTDFHLRFKNSFKNLIFRWKSREPQAYLTFNNYRELAELPLDRGFRPSDLIHPYKKYFVFWSYYRRKLFTKKKHPDFNSPEWCTLFINDKIYQYYGKLLYLNLNSFKEYVEKLRTNKNYYSDKKNRIISKILFVAL